MDILIEFTNNQPLRMLAWIGISYAFIGLGHQKWNTRNYLGFLQVALLLIAFYINFNIEYQKTIQSIEVIKEHYGLKKNE